MRESSGHLDCRNYAPLDVAKGVCHVKKHVVRADEAPCDTFEALPKCKHCRNYLPGEVEYIGVCAASRSRPMAYPDLIGVTCEDFAWRAV